MGRPISGHEERADRENDPHWVVYSAKRRQLLVGSVKSNSPLKKPMEGLFQLTELKETPRLPKSSRSSRLLNGREKKLFQQTAKETTGIKVRRIEQFYRVIETLYELCTPELLGQIIRPACQVTADDQVHFAKKRKAKI